MLAHPAVLSLSHNFSRNDLFLVVFCRGDDWMQRPYGASNLPRKRRGPRDEAFSDSETIAILLVGELCPCPRERAWLRQVRASYGHLFPRLPQDSRFSRRAQFVREARRAQFVREARRAQFVREARRAQFVREARRAQFVREARRAQFVREARRWFRQAVLSWADADREPVRLGDSFPMPLRARWRVFQSSPPISGSGFAFNSSKEEFYFGLHPGLIMTESGFVEDLVLAPAHFGDVTWRVAYLNECLEAGRDLAGQEWVLDKGFVSKALKEQAKALLRLTLLARQRDYKGRPGFWQKLIDRVRKPIEGVISVLTERFGVEHMRARSDMGLYRRAQAKATAFSLGRYFNEALGIAKKRNIARYAV